MRLLPSVIFKCKYIISIYVSAAIFVYFLCRLKHDSVLELYSYFEDESYVYLILEFCEGGELYRHIKSADLTETQGQCQRSSDLSSCKCRNLNRSCPTLAEKCHARQLRSDNARITGWLMGVDVSCCLCNAAAYAENFCTNVIP